MRRVFVEPEASASRCGAGGGQVDSRRRRRRDSDRHAVRACRDPFSRGGGRSACSTRRGATPIGALPLIAADVRAGRSASRRLVASRPDGSPAVLARTADAADRRACDARARRCPAGPVASASACPTIAVARAVCRGRRTSDHGDEREHQRRAGDRRSRTTSSDTLGERIDLLIDGGPTRGGRRRRSST